MKKMTLVKRTINGDDDTMRFWFFDDVYAAMRYIFNEACQEDSIEMVGILPDHITIDTKTNDRSDFIRWDIYDAEVMNYNDVMAEAIDLS